MNSVIFSLAQRSFGLNFLSSVVSLYELCRIISVYNADIKSSLLDYVLYLIALILKWLRWPFNIWTYDYFRWVFPSAFTYFSAKLKSMRYISYAYGLLRFVLRVILFLLREIRYLVNTLSILMSWCKKPHEWSSWMRSIRYTPIYAAQYLEKAPLTHLISKKSLPSLSITMKLLILLKLSNIFWTVLFWFLVSVWHFLMISTSFDVIVGYIFIATISPAVSIWPRS